MRYFVKLIAEYSAKNKPQLEIINFLKKDIDRKIVNNADIIEFKDLIFKMIDEINKKYPRCKPLQITFNIDKHSDVLDRSMSCNLFVLKFYAENLL